VDPAECLQRLGERGEVLMQRPARQPVLLRQREIGKPQLQLFGGGFFVEPVPPPPCQLELDEEAE